jgi:hypothetical protein
VRFLVVSGLENRGQSGKEQGGHAPEFFAVGDRQLAEDAFALRRDLDQDLAMVEGVPVPAHEAEGGQPVDELDDRVMPELELPGERADGGEAVRRQSLDREQQLVLLRLETRLSRLPFAERQEAANQVAEMRQALIVWFFQPRCRRRHD